MEDNEVVARTPVMLRFGDKAYRVRALSAGQVLELDSLIRTEYMRPLVESSLEYGSLGAGMRQEALAYTAGVHHGTRDGQQVLCSPRGLVHVLKFAVDAEIDPSTLCVIKAGPPSWDERAELVFDNPDNQTVIVEELLAPLFIEKKNSASAGSAGN